MSSNCLRLSQRRSTEPKKEYGAKEGVRSQRRSTEPKKEYGAKEGVRSQRRSTELKVKGGGGGRGTRHKAHFFEDQNKGNFW